MRTTKAEKDRQREKDRDKEKQRQIQIDREGVRYVKTFIPRALRAR